MAVPSSALTETSASASRSGSGSARRRSSPVSTAIRSSRSTSARTAAGSACTTTASTADEILAASAAVKNTAVSNPAGRTVPTTVRTADPAAVATVIRSPVRTPDPSPAVTTTSPHGGRGPSGGQPVGGGGRDRPRVADRSLAVPVEAGVADRHGERAVLDRTAQRRERRGEPRRNGPGRGQLLRTDPDRCPYPHPVLAPHHDGGGGEPRGPVPWGVERGREGHPGGGDDPHAEGQREEGADEGDPARPHAAQRETQHGAAAIRVMRAAT